MTSRPRNESKESKTKAKKIPLDYEIKGIDTTGGEGGIRTRGRFNPTHAFQACDLNRSSTSPEGLIIRFEMKMPLNLKFNPSKSLDKKIGGCALHNKNQ